MPFKVIRRANQWGIQLLLHSHAFTITNPKLRKTGQCRSHWSNVYPGSGVIWLHKYLNINVPSFYGQVIKHIPRWFNLCRPISNQLTNQQLAIHLGSSMLGYSANSQSNAGKYSRVGSRRQLVPRIHCRCTAEEHGGIIPKGIPGSTTA